MADPANTLITTGLVALASSTLGPLAGPYALVLVASSAGAFIAASEAHTKTRRDVLVYIVRGALFALACSALLSEWAEIRFGWPAHSLLAVAAVLIGYQAHQVRRLIPSAVRRFFLNPRQRDPDA